ncbi:MAG: MBOAT family O-acyltransferase [Bacteroidales bacterium]
MWPFSLRLVAGPIERFSRLTPQLKANHPFQYENIVNGLRLILYGLFIKMVIADNLSVYVDEIYSEPLRYNSLSVLQGVFFYSFQIYSDFYGYSLIAIGSARMMGVRIMDNFNTPYMARSISEFWQRWHISLSTRFRDYVYFPMGGNRVEKSRWVFNILVVFLVSGLWHGANWTFVIWGGMFGALYIAEYIINKFLRVYRTEKSFKSTHVFLAIKTFVLVTLLWVLFRSSNFHQATDVLSSMFNNWFVEDGFIVEPEVWFFLILFILSDIAFYNSRFDKWIDKKPLFLRWPVYALLIFSIIVFAGVENFPFIYFQF